MATGIPQIDEYMHSRELMERFGEWIPPIVLRRYLDVLFYLRFAPDEWFSKRVTVSRHSKPSKMLSGLLQLAIEENWEVQVR